MTSVSLIQSGPFSYANTNTHLNSCNFLCFPVIVYTDKVTNQSRILHLEI